MLSFLGFNFLMDSYMFLPRPTNIGTLETMQISNGIFDHVNDKTDATFSYDTVIPNEWDGYTLLDCNFNGNINGGNFTYLGFDTIRIKRREFGTFDWVLLFEISVESEADLYFSVYDYFARNLISYEYAFVPVTNEIEGEYVVVEVDSYFNSSYITDANNIYELLIGTQFGSNEQVNKTGTYEPLGRKYPVVISNGDINYRKGSISANIVTSSELQNKLLNPTNNILLQNNITKFLTNKGAKILKDWNGNSFMISVVENIGIVPNNMTGGRLVSISFNYVEIGDPENNDDIQNNNFIKYS